MAMNKKDDNSSFDETQVISKYISNHFVSRTISIHIDFVEKTLLFIKTKEIDSDYKEIIYKELGIIVFSCIEALLMCCLVEIDNQCSKNSCAKQCKYRKSISPDSMKQLSVSQALEQLILVRLFWLSPNEIEELNDLTDYRNYVHISKCLLEDCFNIVFDEDYVERMLTMFYKLLDQFDLNEWYFTNDNHCLKDLDQNDFDSTLKLRKTEMKTHYTYRICSSFYLLYNVQQLNKDMDRILAIVKKDNYDKAFVADYFANCIKHERRRFKDDDAFDEANMRLLILLSKYSKAKNDDSLCSLISKMIKQ